MCRSLWDSTLSCQISDRQGRTVSFLCRPSLADAGICSLHAPDDTNMAWLTALSLQVRPRFLRRGGQYVTLAAIQSLALSVVVPEVKSNITLINSAKRVCDAKVLLGMTLASHRPLPWSAAMAGWLLA